MTQFKLELTKKEFDFLHDWLSDDVDIQLKNPTLNKWGENKLKSIVKKFRKEVKDATN